MDGAQRGPAWQGRKKKLADAARHWVLGAPPGGRDDLGEDARAFGIALEEEHQDDDDFEVWPENWPAVQLFMELGTQWRVAAGMGGLAYLGLDYAAVIAYLRGLRVPEWRERLKELRVMELAAVKAQAERKG